MFLYLASQSPRRRQLLDQIGVRHELLLPDASEDVEALEAECAGEAPAAYVERVTQCKLAAARARLVLRELPAAPILCADTTVALDGALLAKPRDGDEARAMLERLSGRTHEVWSAVAVAHGAYAASRVQCSRVRWRALGDDEIERYVLSGEPTGKAGAYAIQSRAAVWIEHIDGSHSGIMGLPLYETAELLRPLGFRF